MNEEDLLYARDVFFGRDIPRTEEEEDFYGHPENWINN